MSERDYAYIRLAGVAVLTIVTIHGISSRDWQAAHTVGVALGAIATFGPELEQLWPRLA